MTFINLRTDATLSEEPKQFIFVGVLIADPFCRAWRNVLCMNRDESISLQKQVDQISHTLQHLMIESRPKYVNRYLHN